MNSDDSVAAILFCNKSLLRNGKIHGLYRICEENSHVFRLCTGVHCAADNSTF